MTADSANGLKRQAYVWTREHSRERLRLVDRIRETWEVGFCEIGEKLESGGVFDVARMRW